MSRPQLLDQARHLARHHDVVPVLLLVGRDGTFRDAHYFDFGVSTVDNGRI
ncbi:MAG: hypothetical protein WCF30_09470 [Terracidiphilus sp.]